MEEITYTFKEIAELIGVSEEEIIQAMKDEGFLDEKGNPTELAISEGILCTEQVSTGLSLN